jgi:hypothetical protein
MEDMRKGECPLCKHDEVIEAIAMDLAPVETAWPPGTGAFAAAVTHTFREGNTFASHGIIRRYVRRRCGYMQSFADSPADIPIDAAHRTRLIGNRRPSGPYR